MKSHDYSAHTYEESLLCSTIKDLIESIKKLTKDVENNTIPATEDEKKHLDKFNEIWTSIHQDLLPVFSKNGKPGFANREIASNFVNLVESFTPKYTINTPLDREIAALLNNMTAKLEGKTLVEVAPFFNIENINITVAFFFNVGKAIKNTMGKLGIADLLVEDKFSENISKKHTAVLNAIKEYDNNLEQNPKIIIESIVSTSYVLKALETKKKELSDNKDKLNRTCEENNAELKNMGSPTYNNCKDKIQFLNDVKNLVSNEEMAKGVIYWTLPFRKIAKLTWIAKQGMSETQRTEILIKTLFGDSNSFDVYLKEHMGIIEGLVQSRYVVAKSLLLDAITEKTNELNKAVTLIDYVRNLDIELTEINKKIEETNKKIFMTKKADKTELQTNIDNVMFVCKEILNFNIWKRNEKLLCLSTQLDKELSNCWTECSSNLEGELKHNKILECKNNILVLLDQIDNEVKNIPDSRIRNILSKILYPLTLLVNLFISLTQKLLSFTGVANNKNSMFSKTKQENIGEKIALAKESAEQLSCSIPIGLAILGPSAFAEGDDFPGKDGHTDKF